MLSMRVVFTQILVILLYVLIGFAAGKCGAINPEQRKFLTRLCTNIILPFTILSASNQAITRQEMARLGVAALLVMASFILTTCLTRAVLAARKAPVPLRATAASLVTYPNCTFLGLPLCRALFGDMAILYNAVMLVAFNVMFFTWQYSLFTGERFRLRNLATPPTLSTFALILMLFLGLRFPDPVQTVASSTGAMITPLSLMIIGVMMSENPILDILRERRSYLIALLRNLVIPILTMPVLRWMPFDPTAQMCLMVYLACPCATLTSIYAIQSDMEPVLAARTVLLSTLLFAGTLPIIILLGRAFFGA